MSVLVVDAALVVDLLCGFPAADGFSDVLVGADDLAAPAHLDAEVLSALGRLDREGRLTQPQARLAALESFPVTRFPVPALLRPAWQLTDRIATRDALYVALVRSLDAALVTTDARLRRGARDLVGVVEPLL